MANFFDQFDGGSDPPPASEGGPLRITVRPLPAEGLAPAQVARNNPLPVDGRARDLAIRTIYGEAANEPDDGKAAVAAVIRNRAQAGRYGGSDVPSVVMAKNQFEPWNRADARARMLALRPGSPEYEAIGQIVDGVFTGQTPDPTNGATHFFAPQAQAALGRDVPSWGRSGGQPIGRHTFFAPEGRVGSSDVSAQAKKPTNFFDQFDGQAAPAAAPAEPNLPSSSGLPGGLGSRRGREDRQVGAGEALGRGAAQGVTANFYDELRGLVEAGGANPNDPASLSALLAGAVKYWTGDQEAVQRYDAAKKREQAAYQEAEQQRPGMTIAGNVAGAVALPLGGALNAATTAGRVGRSMAVGAGYGAAAGAGEGDGAADRASRAASGGAVGGLVGAAAVPVLAGAELAVRGAGRALEPVRNAMRGQAGVDQEAARRVVGALERDIRAGDNALTPQQVVQGRNAGQPVGLTEWGGETTRGLARSAANTSSEGRAALQNLADVRFEGQADRATQFIRNLVGGNVDTAATREGLRTAAQTVNRPAYNAAYQHPRAQGMWDDGFEQLSQAPVVQNAIRAASVTGANRGTAEGFQRTASPFTIDRATGQLTLRTNPDGSQMLPNLQFWDHVKRNLDKIGTPEARTLNTALKAHLDDLVPDYAAARAGAARFFEADDALTAGENFVRQNVGMPEARRALAAMSAEERELFRQGFAARIIDDISSTRDRVNVLNKIAQSPQARQKMEMALGPQGFQRVEAFLTVEQAMDRLRTAVSGNSTTARQLYSLGQAGGAGYGAYNYNDPQSLAMGAIAAALSTRGKRVDERVARRVAEMLTSTDPNVLARGMRTVASNQGMVRAFRDLDQQLARIGAQQTPAPSMLQAAGVGRAENEQPEIPRPPSQ